MKSKITSTIFHIISTGFAVALAMGICLPFASAAGKDPVHSKLGYEAVSVDPAEREEGARDTVIKKEGKEIARIPNAVPISFSPDGGILLMHDAAPDDDCRYFLFNVAAGEKSKPFGKRQRIGGRYVKKAEWTKDGKTITFTNKKELSDIPVETIAVADYLAKVPAK